ncbi:MAG TPA: transporter [Desulfuromonadales bacterium]|nr:transporter [Desulfuromonadales bacterium]
MVKYSSKRIFPGGIVLLLGVLLAAAPSFAAEAPEYSVGLGVDFATGDYNTDTTTDSWRVPLTIGYFPTDRLDFELVVPYVHQSNSNTLLSGGMRFPFERRTDTRRTSFDSSDSVSGLGDISLTAGYLLMKESKASPGVRPLLYLKFPTADEDEGLGTGEFDVGTGLGVSKWFGRWYTFAEGRYIFQGSNDELGLEDYATLTAESGYRMTRNFLPSISLWWSSAPADDASDIAEARLNGTYWLSDDVSLQGYLGKGLTETAADFGAGVAVYYSF